jgi:sigma-B regulation protein RsbU (phosphoserine phosphatase)
LALNFEDDKYFSIFFGLFDKNTLELQYINAGHNCEPLMKRNHQVSKLKARGYPICNIFESVSYEIKKTNLQVGDNILFYTDGITEMKNTAGEYFGEMRLIDLFQNEQNIIKKIGEEIDAFDGLNSDDLALLDIKVI